MSVSDQPLRGCDFCAAQPAATIEALPAHIRGDYTDPQTGEARTFEMRAHGNWAVCSTCRGLVEAGDRDGLAERALQNCFATHIGELARLRPRDRSRLIREHRAALRGLADELLGWQLENPEALGPEPYDDQE